MYSVHKLADNFTVISYRNMWIFKIISSGA